MTPKEEAEQLIKKFDGLDSPHIAGDYFWYHKSKECALICVDVIQKSMEEVMPNPPFQEYWNEVKQEIEKL